PRIPGAALDERAPRLGSRFGDHDPGDNLVRLQDRLRDAPRSQEELLGRDASLAVRTRRRDLGAERDEGRRRIGWMRHDANAEVEDREVGLVVPGDREALAAAPLEADELGVAKIPAPGPLTEVPANRPDLPDLGGRDEPRRLRQRG